MYVWPGCLSCYSFDALNYLVEDHVRMITHLILLKSQVTFIRNACWAFVPSPDTCPPKITTADICPP